MTNMGIGKLGATNTCFKHKNRWLFSLPEISGDEVNALPPSTSSRPSLTFKEQSVEHTSETIWFPTKPEFKPINIKLYDIVTNKNAVFEWIKQIYNPQSGQWQYGQGPIQSSNPAIFGIKRTAKLALYNGCGDQVLESWVYENAYPTEINFGDLDYADGTVLFVDITLRYDRAYVTNGAGSGGNGSIGDGSNDGSVTGGAGYGYGMPSSGNGSGDTWGFGLGGSSVSTGGGGSVSYIIRKRRVIRTTYNTE